MHMVLQGGGSGTPYVTTRLQKFCGLRLRRSTPCREGPALGGRQVGGGHGLLARRKQSDVSPAIHEFSERVEAEGGQRVRANLFAAGSPPYRGAGASLSVLADFCVFHVFRCSAYLQLIDL